MPKHKNEIYFSKYFMKYNELYDQTWPDGRLYEKYF